MRIAIWNSLLFAVMLVALDARAQSEQKQLAETAGSISGQVTLGGKPASGIRVLAFKDNPSSEERLVVSVKTDQHGRFQFTDLPSDHYRIVPLAPAYIALDQTQPERSGKAVSVAEREIIEGFDFALVRGGVITGRITDEEGQPVTGEMVALIQLDSEGRKRPLYYFSLLDHYDFSTDDQGTYRIFGLHPGRYLVSVGKGTEQGGSKVEKSRYNPLTFYPGVTDESKAGIVELTAGAEATGIDIAFGPDLKAYSASGRVIDANTGKPIPGAQIGYGITHEFKSGGFSSSFNSGLSADARGNFRLDGLLPGTFYVLAVLKAESGLYSKAVSFQIKDQDITGLEIKVNRGSIISGVLTVEGVNDPEITARISRLKLWASVSPPDISRGTTNMERISEVSPDGSFYITGLHPGKIYLHLGNNPDSKGFFLSRVERGGVEHANGIEVGPDEQVSGVRVILGYASGRIRGQVKIEGGTLPPDASISIRLWRVDVPSQQSVPRVHVDPNGRFAVENLVAGEYEISASVYPPPTPSGGPVSPLGETLNKIILVTNGTESEVLLVVKLIAKNKDR